MSHTPYVNLEFPQLLILNNHELMAFWAHNALRPWTLTPYLQFNKAYAVKTITDAVLFGSEPVTPGLAYNCYRHHTFRVF